ncbi:hypothetical protein TgHK011_008703 [Trichoderma gracile]|nr:hypothetical protein TgHK011_008703 [Trichoderma gracile]
MVASGMISASIRPSGLTRQIDIRLDRQWLGYLRQQTRFPHTVLRTDPPSGSGAAETRPFVVTIRAAYSGSLC